MRERCSIEFYAHIYIHTVDGWTDKERERSVIDRRDNLLLV